MSISYYMEVPHFVYRYLNSGNIDSQKTLTCIRYTYMWLIDWLIDCMNAFCHISFFKVWVRLKFLDYNSEICIWLTKAWQENFKSTVTVYFQYFHGGENIDNFQRSIYEGKSSPNTSPGLLYSCEEPFLTLGYWEVYDEVVLMTSWACQVILSFGRDEIHRQLEGSAGVTKCVADRNTSDEAELWFILSGQQFWTEGCVQCTFSLNDASLPCNSFRMISGYSLRYGLFT